jgi:hypothetical protein
MNKLQGNIPVTFSNINALQDFDVSDNQALVGCAPLKPLTVLHYNGTQVTGLCSGDHDQVEQQQQDALWQVRYMRVLLLLWLLWL